MKSLDPQRLTGEYSEVIDMLASEYSWSYEEILDLEVVRIKQLVAAIRLRSFAESRVINEKVSWFTRVISRYSSMGAQLPPESRKELDDAISTIGFDEFDRSIAEEVLAVPAPKENKVGSYEKFMQMLGASGGQRM